MGRRKNTGKVKKIKELALERIDILMNLAEEEFNKGNYDRMKRYIELSRKIAMKVRLPFPKKWKRRICKSCNTVLIFGKGNLTFMAIFLLNSIYLFILS